MSKLVISGYYGFGNAGDEAMLAAILEAILDVIPNAEITVISGNPKDTMDKHGVKAISRLSPLPIIKALKGCDLLISGGGSLLQDVTSDRSLYYYLSIIRMAKWFNRPVMLYAQGIGPLLRERAKKAVAKVLNNVDLITVRDDISKQALLDLNIKTPIYVTADAVLSMHPVDSSIGKRLLSQYDLKGVRPKIGVAIREWKQEQQYHKNLAVALDRLSQECNADIIFIPMQHPQDTNESYKVASQMEHKPIVLNRAYTTAELFALTGSMDVLIGVRLHALVFASLMEKPVVGISYDPKIDSFLEMIGKRPMGTLSTLDSDALYEEVKRLLYDKYVHEGTLKRIRKLREESLRNAHMALDLLKQNSVK